METIEKTTQATQGQGFYAEPRVYLSKDGEYLVHVIDGPCRHANGYQGEKSDMTPAVADCYWLRSPDGNREHGVAMLNGVPYLLSPIWASTNGRKVTRGVVGWRLAKGDGTLHDVRTDAGPWTCDCIDYVHNRAVALTAETRSCKHIQSLQQLLHVVDFSYARDVMQMPDRNRGEP